MAFSLLEPDPLPSMELLVGQNVGDVTQPLANYTVAVTDDSKSISETGLAVEKQTIRQGRAELQVGQAAGEPTRNLNRDRRSSSDTTEPGSVFDTERLANDAVTSTQISDGAVITPKLAANAVIAGKIAADQITANEIDVLDLDTNELTVGSDAAYQIEFAVTDDGLGGDIVQMLPSSDQRTDLGSSTKYWRDVWVDNLQWHGGILEPASASNSVNAALFDNGETGLYPDVDNTGQLGGVVASSTRGFADVQSHAFTTLTPEPLDGVDLSKLTGYSWREPPAYVAQKKASASSDREYSRRNPRKGVDLGQMANYLFEVCKAQQSLIDSLEGRVSALEDA